MALKEILAIVIFLGTCLPAGAGERLRVATEGAYPPLNFVDERGQLAGFDVDIAKALCDALKAECEIVAVPWERLLTELAAGRHDMIVASMGKTPERERWAEFTHPYYRTRIVFVGRPDIGVREVSPATVRGKVLATQSETVQASYLERYYRESAVLKLTDTLPAAFDALARGEADFVLSDNLAAYSFLRSDTGQLFETIGEPLPLDELPTPAHIQVRKGNLRLCDAINKALNDIWLNGTYHKINAKYFPFDIY